MYGINEFAWQDQSLICKRESDYKKQNLRYFVL
jgi:hypothetical protein